MESAAMDDLWRTRYRADNAIKNLPPNLNLRDMKRTFTKIHTFRKITREEGQSDYRGKAKPRRLRKIKEHIALH